MGTGIGKNTGSEQKSSEGIIPSIPEDELEELASNKRTKWTYVEEEFLKKYMDKLSYRALAKQFQKAFPDSDRTGTAVISKIRRLKDNQKR